jgi:hypothetical protein
MTINQMKNNQITLKTRKPSQFQIYVQSQYMFKLKTFNFKNEYLGFKAMIITKKQNLNELKQPKLNESTPTRAIGHHSLRFILYHGFQKQTMIF